MTEPEFMAKKRSRGNPRLMSELPRYKAGVSGRKQEIWRSRTADTKPRRPADDFKRRSFSVESDRIRIQFGLTYFTILIIGPQGNSVTVTRALIRYLNNVFCYLIIPF